MNGCKWYCAHKFSKEEIEKIIDKKLTHQELSPEELKIFKICNKPDCYNSKLVQQVCRLYTDRLIEAIEKNIY